MAGGERVSTWASLKAASRSWRLGAVALLQLSSGLPLGLVWIAIPTWMKQKGADIRVVGLFALAQAPWTFKFLWSPILDRYELPFMGRRRGWILAMQACLLGLGMWLSSLGESPAPALVAGVAVLTALASATQDIAIDAYAVDVLEEAEYGLASGARVAFYRTAMFLSGALAISVAAGVSWRTTNLSLALFYLPLMALTVFAPEGKAQEKRPLSLKEAVFEPLVEFLARKRALEILAFVCLYKLSEGLAQALIRPFLVEKGYSTWDIGFGTGVVGWWAIVLGSLLGGAATPILGLGRALWVFGVLQMSAHAGYAMVALHGVNRPLMYLARVLEDGTSGMATGAFGVLLLRLTRRRFSATQYALVSSLLAVSRTLMGPVAGVLADAIGWPAFFLFAVVAGVPGLVMLNRFSPLGVRDPPLGEEREDEEPLGAEAAVPRAKVLGKGLSAGILTLLVCGAVTGCLDAVKSFRAGHGFAVLPRVLALLRPQGLAAWVTTSGLLAVSAAVGTAAAAATYARGRAQAPRGGG